MDLTTADECTQVENMWESVASKINTYTSNIFPYHRKIQMFAS